MTVFYDPKSKGYRYDFRYLKRRHTASRGFETKREARDAEAELRRKLRRRAAGLEVGGGTDSPRFSDWAEVYMDFLERHERVTAPEAIEHSLRVVLRFWGARPDRPLKPHEDGPYHDLRLLDPIANPSLILKFEEWMIERGVAGTTRNRYRTAVSRLYAIAMLPQYRAATGVTYNPFRGVLRDRERGRTVVLTVDQLRAIMTHAPAHLRLAIVIAALAPKLRLGNILALRWDQHISPDLRLITVTQHKTAGRTGRPMVTPISAQLRQVLEAAKKRSGRRKWVVQYQGKPVTKIVNGLAAACEAAGVPYGRAVNGPTFHTIRHTAATMLARLGVPEALRTGVMGQTIATVQRYTHLEPAHQVAPLEQLSAAFPLHDLLGGGPIRQRRSVVGAVVGLAKKSADPEVTGRPSRPARDTRTSTRKSR